MNHWLLQDFQSGLLPELHLYLYGIIPEQKPKPRYCKGLYWFFGTKEWNWGLRWACGSGHRELVELMIQKGATDWDWGLFGACGGGHGREEGEWTRRGGGAEGVRGSDSTCRGGHLELVDLMIQKGATAWDLGLYGACEGGHLELAELMIQKGATDWDWGLGAACQRGHRELAELMIQKGARSSNQFLLSC